jgi:predicted lipoprotein with Yx(FWY)xxD motif
LREQLELERPLRRRVHRREVDRLEVRRSGRAGEHEPGKVLVDGNGRTLYLFEADKGTMSKCDGACAAAWPPLTSSGKPTAGAGVNASKLGTTKRPDGTTGVTYAGHPLYTYAGDTAKGQTAGEGLTDYGAEWYALSAAGKTVER